MFSAVEAAKKAELFGIEKDSDTQDKLNIVDKSRTSFFPWRGQFSPQFVEHLISEFNASSILDPFCGSGTTLYEASRESINSAGADINPAAYILASLVSFCKMSKAKRTEKLDKISERILKSKYFMMALGSSEGLIPKDVISNLSDSIRNDKAAFSIYAAMVMIGVGNGEEISVERFAKGFNRVYEVVLNLPYSNALATPLMRDARRLPFRPGTFDLVLTSPPYINVFNYHQNYRKIVEILGFEPLKVASAEIGSNRKHRSNRFLTVIQYCIDMGASLVEMRRLLSQQGHIVMVVGRTSSVRSVSFENGKLIAMVASDGLGFKLNRWQERVFTNRFGERIFEDILTLQPGGKTPSDYLSVGREVGKWALETAIVQHSDEIVRSEVSAAIMASNEVRESPLLDSILTKKVEDAIAWSEEAHHPLI